MMRGKQSFLSCLVSFTFWVGRQIAVRFGRDDSIFLAELLQKSVMVSWIIFLFITMKTFPVSADNAHSVRGLIIMTSLLGRKGTGTKPLYTYQINTFTLLLPLDTNQCFPSDHCFFYSNLITAVFVGLFGIELKWKGKTLIFHLIPIFYFCIVDVCLHAWFAMDWFISEHWEGFWTLGTLAAAWTDCTECQQLPTFLYWLLLGCLNYISIQPCQGISLPLPNLSPSLKPTKQFM